LLLSLFIFACLLEFRLLLRTLANVALHNHCQRQQFLPVVARRVRVAILHCYENRTLNLTFASLRACVESTGCPLALRLFEGFLRLHVMVCIACSHLFEKEFVV
jgi:hypothetical protein